MLITVKFPKALEGYAPPTSVSYSPLNHHFGIFDIEFNMKRFKIKNWKFDSFYVAKLIDDMDLSFQSVEWS